MARPFIPLMIKPSSELDDNRLMCLDQKLVSSRSLHLSLAPPTFLDHATLIGNGPHRGVSFSWIKLAVGEQPVQPKTPVVSSHLSQAYLRIALNAINPMRNKPHPYILTTADSGLTKLSHQANHDYGG